MLYFKKNIIYLSFLLMFCASAQNKETPNIILILVDDMGFADLGCYGNTVIKTPNLDTLSNQGLRFAQFYNAARCSPTRASLLTGLYPHQAGMGYLESLNKGEGHPGYQGQLTRNSITIAEVLKMNGYFTAMSGKWHVGAKYGLYPWNRGFDRSLTPIKAAFYFPEENNANTLYLNGKPIDPFSEQLPENWYSSDLYSEFGLRFIDEANDLNKPFFLYLAFNAPHFPVKAPEENIRYYKDKFDEGWDKMRIPIYHKQLKMGLIKEDWSLSKKNEDVPEWNQLTPENKDRMAHIQEIYAACIERMDFAVGTLVEGLKERGKLENTLIVFMSDNGANAEQGPFGRYSGEEKSGSASSNVFQGQSWATYSNTPFRRYKHFTHEGGISTPLIIHWPEGLADSQNGKIVQSPSHIMDIMPTLVELTNSAYPDEFNGVKIDPMEGKSLLPIFRGNSTFRSEPIFWEHEGNRAVRKGKWKIVSINNNPWELYNIDEDRTEQRNLAQLHPTIVKELSEKYKIWAVRCNVEPWPDNRNSAGQPFDMEPHYQIQSYSNK